MIYQKVQRTTQKDSHTEKLVFWRRKHVTTASHKPQFQATFVFFFHPCKLKLHKTTNT